MRLFSGLLLSTSAAIAWASDVPAEHSTEVCTDAVRGLNCCENNDVFSPGAACDSCSATEDCLYVTGSDEVECVCKAGYAKTGTSTACTAAYPTGTCAWASGSPEFYTSLSELETDSTVSVLHEYTPTINPTTSADFVPSDSFALYIGNTANPAMWPVPLDAILLTSTTDIIGMTLAEILADTALSGGSITLDFQFKYSSIAGDDHAVIEEKLLTGENLFLSFVSVADLAPPTGYADDCNLRVLYNPKGRTNYGETSCFYDTQCDVGISSCIDFDPLFPDTPGTCDCLWGTADAAGVCPKQFLCDAPVLISGCTDTLEFNDTSTELECNANAVDIVREDVSGFSSMDCELASVDLSYSYDTRIPVNYTVTHASGAHPDISGWTLSADKYIYDTNGPVVTASSLNLTESFELFSEEITENVTRVTGYIIIGITNSNEAALTAIAIDIFENEPVEDVSIVLFTGDRYIQGGCGGCNPRLRHSDVLCYYLSATECTGGCSYTDRETIDCTAPTVAPTTTAPTPAPTPAGR